ncbi:hypothetical protein Fot_28611 [Forsythia ovata]|uniref:Uncharacterized protein n=1 Tax=Forsythia ovata TaxID=205694 RepID=A0ABD1TQC8_9LAMI
MVSDIGNRDGDESSSLELSSSSKNKISDRSIPTRPPSPDNSNVRKGLAIIDLETGEEQPRLEPSKLQCKPKRDKRKSKQEKDDMSSRRKRHRSSTSVKVVEIVELSDSESDVLDDKVKEVEVVEGDAMGLKVTR